MTAAKTASLWDRIAAADPGLLRLVAGLRAVLGLTLTLAALAMLDQSSAVLLAGGFTAVVTSLAISDPHPRNQFLTLLAGVPVGLAALTAGGLLAPFPLVSHLAFLLLIFAAVYTRRFGRRGLDLGIFAFMAYFLSQFARIQPHQLPQMIGASAVAFAAAAVTRLCLVPMTSRGSRRRLRAAFERDRMALQPGAAQPSGPWRYATRQAFQVTAAAALATLGGHLVSPHLWYWAVATAWVVFVNAEHTRDILLRSGWRLIGTVAGVPFGYGLAVLAAGNTPLALAFLLACVFGMFYTPSGSYWAVTFFITGSLSMVLAALHTLSPELLALRVQETVLGVGCGILAAGALEALREACRTVCRTACRSLLHPLDPRRAERARVRRVLERVEATSFHAQGIVPPQPSKIIRPGRGRARRGACRAGLGPPG